MGIINVILHPERQDTHKLWEYLKNATDKGISVVVALFFFNIGFIFGQWEASSTITVGTIIVTTVIFFFFIFFEDRSQKKVVEELIKRYGSEDGLNKISALERRLREVEMERDLLKKAIGNK